MGGVLKEMFQTVLDSSSDHSTGSAVLPLFAAIRDHFMGPLRDPLATSSIVRRRR